MRRKKEQGALSLREKYLNAEFCLVRIFPVFSPNTRKYGPGKAWHLDTFHSVCLFQDQKYGRI